MVAYKNDKYLHFGWCAAKLDDIANFIPARISAFLMILAAFVCRLDWKNAWRIFKRDRYNHASPNSAQTEAVMAGALDVHLREMLIILENYMRNLQLETRFGK